jgi:hypothetical protein
MGRKLPRVIVISFCNYYCITAGVIEGNISSIYTVLVYGVAGMECEWNQKFPVAVSYCC